jgi:hypothetical protein
MLYSRVSTVTGELVSAANGTLVCVNHAEGSPLTFAV